MKLYSTKDKTVFTDFRTAIFKGLPDDNGLFMPETIPTLSDDFFRTLGSLSFQDIAYSVSRSFLAGAVPDSDLRSIVDQAINFPAPLVKLDDSLFILELTHGPTLAFKDFGARFMAGLMSYFNRDEKDELVILVATSGDTGGAVAFGFHNVPGIKVVILYPKGKVSELQEKQLTTLGGNITAIEVDGSFDDCQHLVKQAFLDKEFCASRRFSSANSINISRLIPQTFYYFEAVKQLGDRRNIVFSVPSGNFGNLTAGLIAKRMGLPIMKFIAATNVNDIVPHYLNTGVYVPKSSVETISNAMDVGNPSNFARMHDLYGSTWNSIREDVVGYGFTDVETRRAMCEVYNNYNYVIDPHGAVGVLALNEFKKSMPDVTGVVLETAHPAKFIDEVEQTLDITVVIPERLEVLRTREKVAFQSSVDYGEFKSVLISLI
ncbi:MAG: threonine synthase [Saprospiraceae bacterium]